MGYTGYDDDDARMQVDGTIVAPGEPKDWDPKLSRIWLNFHNLSSAIFQGKGVLDGSGSKWWAASCKKNKTNVILCLDIIGILNFDQKFSWNIIHLLINLRFVDFSLRCSHVKEHQQYVYLL